MWHRRIRPWRDKQKTPVMPTDTTVGGPITGGSPSHHRLFAVGAVLLGPFIVNFHARLFNIGLADLRGALGLSFDEGAWLNTFATAPQILIAPAIAWFATAFGVRRVLIGPSLLYALISLVIPFVHNFRALTALHLVDGLLLGVFVPATLMIIFRNLPRSWWVAAIGIYAFRQSFSGNSGIALVGFYIQSLGWRWIYWQDVVLAPVMALFAYLGAPSERMNNQLVKDADWGGMLLFGAGLSLIYAAFDQGNRLDWFESGIIVSLLTGGVFLLVVFLINEQMVDEPWANVGVLFSRNTALLNTIAVLFTITSVSNTLLVPNFLGTIANLRPEQMGHLLLTYVGGPLIFLTIVAIYLLRRIDGRLVLLIGLGGFALSSWLGTGLTADWGPADFIPVVLLQAIGYGFTFVSVIVLSVANGNPRRSTAMSAYIQVIRVTGAEFATALMTTWLRKDEQIQSNLIGLHIGHGSIPVETRLSALTAHFASFTSGTAGQRGVKALSDLVQQQANVLAYIDGFWMTFWVAVAALVLLALVRPAPLGPFTPPRRRLSPKRA